MIDYTMLIKDYLDSKPAGKQNVYFTIHDLVIKKNGAQSVGVTSKRQSFAGWLRYHRKEQLVSGWDISVHDNTRKTVIQYRATRR